MGPRGRGRGSSSFSREINERIGIPIGNSAGPNEVQVEAVNEPPPLYPPLENRPVPLETGVEGEYLLALKRDFVEYFHDSPSYLQHTVVKSDIQRFSDRYQTATLASRTITELVRDWSHLPKELNERGSKPLRRKRQLKPLKGKAKVLKKTEDNITNRLEELEKREEEGSDAENVDADGNKVEIKEENKDAESEVEEDVEDEDVDEEMDDGNDDYVNNYFDNGEDYLDEEDDNLDEGGVY